MKYCIFASDLGPVMVAGDDVGIRYISLLNGPKEKGPHSDWTEDGAAFEEEIEQLQSYLAGERRTFNMSLRPEGTEFQESVWTALKSIPYGKTMTYGEIAAQIGRPRAVRAVGAANGANPIGIVIPCHRVIGADGSLTGYGGGLPNKRALLELEGVEI